MVFNRQRITGAERLAPTAGGIVPPVSHSLTQEPETMNQIIARLIGQKAAAKLPEQLRDIIEPPQSRRRDRPAGLLTHSLRSPKP